ncbi:phosphohistidine phosphatase SixA [Billgrantia azerbaijanica]|nr:phosphohistidine phosphatase SixA [Halomonas azerbaijanica]
MSDPLLIMRHGEAAPGHPDISRELTARGHAEVARVASWLAQRDDLARLRLVASPFVRAQQTAAPIAAALGIALETQPMLTPDDAPAAVVDWLLTEPDDRPLLLVSHMPLVGALTGLLVEGRADRGVGFATATVAELAGDVRAAGCLRLARFTSPADLARP